MALLLEDGDVLLVAPIAVDGEEVWSVVVELGDVLDVELLGYVLGAVSVETLVLGYDDVVVELVDEGELVVSLVLGLELGLVDAVVFRFPLVVSVVVLGLDELVLP